MFFTNLLEANMQTKNFSFKYVYYPKTKSTNQDIWELYNHDDTKKYFVITDNQTQGRGRNNHPWISSPNKSITCSFLLDQIFDEKKINFHSLIIPLAIIKGIKKFTGLKLSLKWPNDIIYNNRKLGGILIESKKKQASYIFNIGIGINVNEDLDDFPNSIKNNVTSLKLITQNNIQREPLMASILNELDSLIDNNNIINEWINNCCHIDKKINFNYKNQSVEGIFKDINNNGQAIIQYNNKFILYGGAIQTV